MSYHINDTIEFLEDRISAVDNKLTADMIQLSNTTEQDILEIRRDMANYKRIQKLKERVAIIVALLILTICTLLLVNDIMIKQSMKLAEAVPRTINIDLTESESFDYADEELYKEPVIGIDGEIIPYDVIILAHVINGEAGSNWCKDEMLYGVGSVVLNRVKDKRFPNTIEEVVFQNGQYACTWDGNYDKEPCERAWRIAWDLYENGTTWPSNVIFQAQFTQGHGTYKQIQNMYFCYKD